MLNAALRDRTHPENLTAFKVHMHIYTRTHIHAYTYTYTHTHTHIHTYTHARTHSQAGSTTTQYFYFPRSRDWHRMHLELMRNASALANTNDPYLHPATKYKNDLLRSTGPDPDRKP